MADDAVQAAARALQMLPKLFGLMATATV